jgi:hypothetical protein
LSPDMMDGVAYVQTGFLLVIGNPYHVTTHSLTRVLHATVGE